MGRHLSVRLVIFMRLGRNAKSFASRLLGARKVIELKPARRKSNSVACDSTRHRLDNRLVLLPSALASRTID